MTNTIIPLRSDRGATSALAAVDVAAVELLREGDAATLSSARFAAIRADLLAKRVQLAAVIADLRLRSPSGDARIDTVNATLCTQADAALAYVDLFLEEVETCTSHAGFEGLSILSSTPYFCTVAYEVELSLRFRDIVNRVSVMLRCTRRRRRLLCWISLGSRPRADTV